MMLDIGEGLLHLVIFFVPVAVIAAVISMYMWEKTCRTQIKTVIIKKAGGIDIKYVPKEGSDITITNPKTGDTRTWPISDLATIGMPYPDLAGLLPRFLQREIQVAFVYEDDMEPVINKDRTRKMIADPAVLGALKQNTIMRALATVSDDVIESIKGLSRQLSRIAGLNPMLIYLGIFAAIALGIANIVISTQSGAANVADMANKVDAIYKSLGITP